MKTHTIIGGVNGVGTSSFTDVLKEFTMNLGNIIHVDKIAAEPSRNTLSRDNTAFNKIQDRIVRNIFYTQETTLSRYKTEATVKQVKEPGCHVRMFKV